MVGGRRPGGRLAWLTQVMYWWWNLDPLDVFPKNGISDAVTWRPGAWQERKPFWLKGWTGTRSLESLRLRVWLWGCGGQRGDPLKPVAALLGFFPVSLPLRVLFPHPHLFPCVAPSHAGLPGVGL